jgi:lysozyme
LFFPTRTVVKLAFTILAVSVSSAGAATCPNGAAVDNAEHCFFVQYIPPGQLRVDPRIADRIPPTPNGREVRSFALIVSISKYPNQDRDQNLDAVSRDLPNIILFVKGQGFDEIVVLKDADASSQNIEYFLTTYFYNAVEKYDHRSRFLFAYDMEYQAIMRTSRVH